MSWNPKLSVGVAVIDDDHQKLVSMVNELYDAIQAGRGKDSLGPTLAKLVDYTKFHFGREEDFMAKTSYPAAVDHKREHDGLTKQVLDVQGKYQSGAAATLSLEVMNFLKNWLLQHIQGSDKKYGPHLNAQGIH
jgi:hemerythrin